jgi:hypothetical protein
MSHQAAQFGAGVEAVKEIGNAKNFEQALQVAGQYLGEPFRLQVEAQNFNQYIQQAQLDIARDQLDATKDAATAAIEAEARKMSREDIDLARKDPRVTNFETVQALKNRVDQELSNVLDESGQVKWEEAAQSNSTIYALANAAARSQNPEMTRAMGDLGLAATASVEQKIEAMYNKLLKDATANPGKLTEMYRLLNSSHTSSMRDATEAMQQLKANVPGFTIDISMFTNISDAADAFTLAALQDPSVTNPPTPVNQKPSDPFGAAIVDWMSGFNIQ